MSEDVPEWLVRRGAMLEVLSYLDEGSLLRVEEYVMRKSGLVRKQVAAESKECILE